jgi:thymidylate synthase (FAD)
MKETEIYKKTHVQPVAITQPLVEGVNTAEELIVHNARVSNPSNQMNTATAPKLMKFLIKHKHWSPLEMASLSVEIKTSRAIAAQILRHRSFSFQEFSQRYAVVTEMEPVYLRKQAVKNRQSSEEEFDPQLILDKNLPPINASDMVNQLLITADETYKDLIDMGVAKECARMVLPLTTRTTMYMSGTIRSWVHYLLIRTEDHVQLEHRVIAMKCMEVFKEHFPNIHECLMELVEEEAKQKTDAELYSLIPDGVKQKYLPTS